MQLKVVRLFFLIFLLQFTLQSKNINLNEYLESANKANKHLFVWLHKSYCNYCERMKEFTLENEKVEAFISKKFLFVPINVSLDESVSYNGFNGSGREFAKSVGYDFYPTSLFFDENSTIVLTEVGYIDSDVIANEKRIYDILKFIDSKEYIKMDFSEYEFNKEDK